MLLKSQIKGERKAHKNVYNAQAERKANKCEDVSDGVLQGLDKARFLDGPQAPQKADNPAHGVGCSVDFGQG
jgi:hypothetical protein